MAHLPVMALFAFGWHGARISFDNARQEGARVPRLWHENCGIDTPICRVYKAGCSPGKKIAIAPLGKNGGDRGGRKGFAQAFAPRGVVQGDGP